MPEPEDDVEEPSSSAGSSAKTAAPSKGKRPSFAKLARELTQEDLATPGAQKLIIDEMERLDTEVRSLSSFRDDYHEEKTKVAVYEERFKTHTALEIISSGTLAIGALILGFLPSLWANGVNFTVALVLGVLLLVCSFIAKKVKL